MFYSRYKVFLTIPLGLPQCLSFFLLYETFEGTASFYCVNSRQSQEWYDIIKKDWKKKSERESDPFFLAATRGIERRPLPILSILSRVGTLGRLYQGHTIQANQQFLLLLNFQCPRQELPFEVVQAALRLHRQRHLILVHRSD
jgi:hypothetical protein